MPLARDLAEQGGRVALVTGDGEVTYQDLAAMVEAMGRCLGEGRRLVLLQGGNSLDAVVTYLAALAFGHPVLLAPQDRPDVVAALVESYDPDVVAGPGATNWRIHERRTGSAHRLHPDLALLMSTSGSTGSPKLVRLSSQNLQANADAIAQSLGLTDEDRAITTLPLHYCYGLSVLNSHLLTGARVILTDLSVVDAGFWTLMKERRATSLAGVPYTFELLDRVGFADRHLPDLRYVTVAGGRLGPERVRRYAELGREAGWDLVCMYGQTEATARIAYVPTELLLSAPNSIGVAIPGGTLDIEACDEASEPETGELVYRGPNVMMGYALSPEDLNLGAVHDRLRTGDIARRTSDGSFLIIGRRSRFAKLFGLRLDLGRIEDHLAAEGVQGCCLEVDDALAVAVETSGDVDQLRRRTAAFCGLPVGAVHLYPVPALPRLGTGKLDYVAVRALATPGSDVRVQAAASSDLLVSLYAELLDRPDANASSTFVSLGGDSLSYVELSVRLEEVLGDLPVGWHLMSIGALAAPHPDPTGERRRTRAVEGSVVLRAAAIVLVVGSHIGAFTLLGGAHVLLIVAGFNFARFHLIDTTGTRRLRRSMTSVSRIVVPSIVVVMATQALDGRFRLRDVLLMDSLLSPSSAGRFWFVEVLVYLLLAVTVLVALPGVSRWERRWPFALPVVLVLASLLSRYQVVGSTPEAMKIYTAPIIFWLFGLGWAAARATTTGRRLAVSALALITVPGFFQNPSRDTLVLVGIALLVWVPTVRVPAWTARPLWALASASLYIYLTHWQVYPHLSAHSRAAALVASLAAGIGCWWLVTRAPRRARRALSAVPLSLRRLASRVRIWFWAGSDTDCTGFAAHGEVLRAPSPSPVRCS